ncbi:hypothetical protein ElyMa_000269500 [Elysia marginata]|uniref:Uncharacterized protein n=1 Tax=Elysia marginata TaxID=1093978 RepID=A0AAV4F476_9GAST|nr:hypothetical protein ElyMa_000269500 [Elysia marginata]
MIDYLKGIRESAWCFSVPTHEMEKTIRNLARTDIACPTHQSQIFPHRAQTSGRKSRKRIQSTTTTSMPKIGIRVCLHKRSRIDARTSVVKM